MPDEMLLSIVRLEDSRRDFGIAAYTHNSSSRCRWDLLGRLHNILVNLLCNKGQWYPSALRTQGSQWGSLVSNLDTFFLSLSPMKVSLLTFMKCRWSCHTHMFQIFEILWESRINRNLTLLTFFSSRFPADGSWIRTTHCTRTWPQYSDSKNKI